MSHHRYRLISVEVDTYPYCHCGWVGSGVTNRNDLAQQFLAHLEEERIRMEKQRRFDPTLTSGFEPRDPQV